MNIIERLQYLAKGNDLDLADIVCRDAIAEIKLARSEWNKAIEAAALLVEELEADDHDPNELGPAIRTLKRGRKARPTPKMASN